VVAQDIDPETGMLANYYCPGTRTEYFRAGTEPTEYCQLHEDDGGFFDHIRIGIRGAVKELIGLFRDEKGGNRR
jgi:hypothetical protein